MANGQAAPEGAGVLKDAAAGIMQQAQAMSSAAEAFAQAGQEEVAQMIGQAAQLLVKAIEKVGVTQGGQAQAAAPMGPQSPEAAGTNAQPANVARG